MRLSIEAAPRVPCPACVRLRLRADAGQPWLIGPKSAISRRSARSITGDRIGMTWALVSIATRAEGKSFFGLSAALTAAGPLGNARPPIARWRHWRPPVRRRRGWIRAVRLHGGMQALRALALGYPDRKSCMKFAHKFTRTTQGRLSGHRRLRTCGQ